MKKVICQLLSFLLTLVSYAQSVTISPATSGNQTLNSDGINVRLNAKLGTVGNPTNGNLIFQCCGYDNGRVGVGLSSPLSTFHIQDDYASNTTLRLSASAAAGTVKGLELAVDGNLGTKTVFFNQLENAPFKFTINNTTILHYPGKLLFREVYLMTILTGKVHPLSVLLRQDLAEV